MLHTLTRLIPVILFALACGCSPSIHRAAELRASSPDSPTKLELGGVPFVAQGEFQCGPASLAMILANLGQAANLDQIISQTFSPARKGTLQSDMLSAARRQATIAYLIPPNFNSIQKELGAGNPVIVLLNLGLSWWQVWHYAVVIGYDLDSAKVLLRSGNESRQELSLFTFENLWARSGNWGMVVLNPGMPPVSATEEAFIEALLGLERAKHWAEAEAGYRTALERWPSNPVIHLGLSNALLSLNKLNDAKKVLAQATGKFPSSLPILNNYAHVLHSLGENRRALTIAKRAVELSGGSCLICSRTLAEIEPAEKT